MHQFIQAKRYVSDTEDKNFEAKTEDKDKDHEVYERRRSPIDPQ